MLKNIEQPDNNDALETSMVAVAAAMSDPSRVKMLCALMDGRAWTATELSVVADIAASTASAHLNRLVNGNLIICLPQGRHRYFRLAGNEVAALIEMIMGVSWKRILPPDTRTPPQLRISRTCYDHLAGEIAVKIYDYMDNEGWFDSGGNSLSNEGSTQFQKLGVVLNVKTRRKVCCACLDWSERRFHLGGDAGRAFFIHCEQKGWLTQAPGFREVDITSAGRHAFSKLFKIAF